MSIAIKIISLFVFIILLTNCCLSMKSKTVGEINENSDIPVIGILANPDPNNSADILHSKVIYFNVKWLEASTANVIVIQPWFTEKEIDEVLSKVNGVLFQGGMRDLDINGQFERNAGYILKRVMEYYDNGKSIPIWGICQGFQLLHALIADDTKVLTHFKSWNMQSSIEFNVDEIKKTKMFEDFHLNDFNNLKNLNLTAQLHNLGVDPKTYEQYPKLKEFFKITSTGKDLDGKTYINSFEAIKYPIFGVQFHPELVSYERSKMKGIPKSLEATRISQLLGNSFLKQARLNNNSMKQGDLIKYNYIDTLAILPTKSSNNFYYYFFDKIDGLSIFSNTTTR